MKTLSRGPLLAMVLPTAATVAVLLVFLQGATEMPGDVRAETAAADRRPVPVVVVTGGATLVVPLLR